MVRLRYRRFERTGEWSSTMTTKRNARFETRLGIAFFTLASVLLVANAAWQWFR